MCAGGLAHPLITDSDRVWSWVPSLQTCAYRQTVNLKPYEQILLSEFPSFPTGPGMITK